MNPLTRSRAILPASKLGRLRALDDERNKDMNTIVEILVDGQPVDYSGLPEHMQDAMRLYMERGIEPGSFLAAVLCNDFMGAIGHADSINAVRLRDYAIWLHNYAPPASFGSREKYAAWVRFRNA